MKVLVIGGGGREHALIWKLKQSSLITELYCAPGNGGTIALSTSVDIAVHEVEKLCDWVVENKIDFTVVGPELPLSLGITDHFVGKGLKIFGANRQSAMLESSKVFSKRILQKCGIPTPKGETFVDFKAAEQSLSKVSYPVVIKADGLAAGKGVHICPDRKHAEQALKAIMVDKVFKAAGEKVVIEDYLVGEELSYIGFMDENTFLPMASSQDHKKIFEGDKGPNTGGMGAYSPVPWFDAAWQERIKKEVVDPLMRGIREEGLKFRGILYIGLMMSNDIPYVLEFNVRFGDPEAQVLLFRLKSDLFPLLQATASGKLSEIKSEDVIWDKRPAACVVMSSGGYPAKYETGFEIQGLDTLDNGADLALFHAGTVLEDEKIKTAGGRVLNVVAAGDNYKEALDRAYAATSAITWPGAYYRRDIGYRVCQREK